MMSMMSGRKRGCIWLIVLLCVASSVGRGDDSSHAGEQQGLSVRRVSCDEIETVWRELCQLGGCEPREDGGCRKRSASGDCSTMKGCVQGESPEMLVRALFLHRRARSCVCYASRLSPYAFATGLAASSDAAGRARGYRVHPPSCPRH
jgi:hypothetical protein